MSYSLFKNRLDSFSEWSFKDIQNIEKLSEAGFYIINKKINCTQCFSCLEIVFNWGGDEKHDPWQQHAILFPKCPFVKKNNRIINYTTLTTNKENVNECKHAYSCCLECGFYPIKNN